MIEQVVTRNKRPLVALPRVGKAGGAMCCWVCGQAWPSRYDLVVDAVHSTVRLDDSQPLSLSRNELHVLSALVAAFPRWLTKAQLAEHAWDYRPEGDMPDSSVVLSVARKLNAHLHGSRYTIERCQKRGIRLVDVDTILRERGFDDHFAKGIVGKLAQETVASLSNKRVAEKQAEKPVANHRLVGKKTGTKRDRAMAARKKSASLPSRNNTQSKKRKRF